MTTQKVSFITKNELTRTLKRLSKEADKAIDFLSEVMNDPAQDIKVRVDCAKELLSKRVDVSKEISKDMLTRLLAETKYTQTPVKGLKDITPTEESGGATFDFDNVQRVAGVSYPELDEDNSFDLKVDKLEPKS